MAFMRSMALGAVISVDLTSASLTNLGQLTRGLNQAERGLSGLVRGGARAGAAGLAQLALAGTAAAGALGLAAVKSAQFEHAMQGVFSVGETSASDRSALSAKALELGGGRTKFDPMDIAEGMEEMIRAGFKVEEILEGISVMANVAAADEISMAQATDIVGNAFRGFSNDAGLTLAYTGDLLARASADTNTNIRDLGIAMAYAAPIANQLRIPLEDAVATISNMSQVGLKSSKAGRGFASVIQRLAGPTDKATKVLAGLGFEFVKTEAGAVDIIGTMESLASAMDKVTDPVERVQIAKTLTGIDQAKASLTIMDQMLKSVGGTRELRDSWVNIEGAAQRMADTRLDSVIGQMIMAKNAAITMGINLMMAFGPGLKLALSEVKNSLVEINDGLNNIGESWLSHFGRGMKAAIDDINEAIAVTILRGRELIEKVLGPMGPSANEAAFGIGYLTVSIMVLLAVLSPFMFAGAVILFLISGLGEASIFLAGILGILLVGAFVALVSLFATAKAQGMTLFEMLSGWLVTGKTLFTSFSKGFWDVIGPLEERFLPTIVILKAAWLNVAASMRFAMFQMKFLFSPENFETIGRFVGWIGVFLVKMVELGAAFIWIGSLIARWFVVPIATAFTVVMSAIALTIMAIVDVIFTAIDSLFESDWAKWGMEQMGWSIWKKPEGLDFLEIEDKKEQINKDVADALKWAADNKAQQATTGENAPAPVIKDERCLHIKNDLSIDGKKLAIAQAENDIELTERSGFGVTPWQKRAVLERGATVLAR